MFYWFDKIKRGIELNDYDLSQIEVFDQRVERYIRGQMDAEEEERFRGELIHEPEMRCRARLIALVVMVMQRFKEVDDDYLLRYIDEYLYPKPLIVHEEDLLFRDEDDEDTDENTEDKKDEDDGRSSDDDKPDDDNTM